MSSRSRSPRWPPRRLRECVVRLLADHTADREPLVRGRPGHTVAIVGPTGAGKTTLVNLIMRAELRSQVITIAHRLSTIRDAHTILVMQNGAIVEQGSHDELLEREGAYFDLYMTQFHGEDAEAFAADDPNAAAGEPVTA